MSFTTTPSGALTCTPGATARASVNECRTEGSRIRGIHTWTVFLVTQPPRALPLYPLPIWMLREGGEFFLDAQRSHLQKRKWAGLRNKFRDTTIAWKPSPPVHCPVPDEVAGLMMDGSPTLSSASRVPVSRDGERMAVTAVIQT
jgi:hypothetical protein